MKYAIVEVVNGNYFVRAEGITDLATAKKQFHGRCQALWDAPDVLSATVKIMDERLDRVEGYQELITHEPQSEPEPESEEN